MMKKCDFAVSTKFLPKSKKLPIGLCGEESLVLLLLVVGSVVE